MKQTFAAFPLFTSINAASLSTRYGLQDTHVRPRVIAPTDPDYDDLFDVGYAPIADYHVLLDGGTYDEDGRHILGARPGQSFNYWTRQQAETIRSVLAQVTLAQRIHAATLDFLVLEGYLHQRETSQQARETVRTYLLTSKGFTHLNKTFEGNTISDAMRIEAAKTVFHGVKGAGEVAAAGEQLLKFVLAFLS